MYAHSIRYMKEHIAKLEERQRAIHDNRNELLLKAKAELADLQRKQEKMDAGGMILES